MPKPKKSLFIVFEGLDGAGTTTQIDLLASFLRNEGIEKVLVTKEPTNNIVGGLIRGCLTGDWKTTPAGLQLLFAADRAHHLDHQIKPALQDGFIVITDRYYISSLAYGSVDLEKEWIYKINEKFLKPNLAFFIDVTPETAIQRMQKVRHNLELFEKKETLQKVRQNYLEIAKKEKNLYIINGEEMKTRVRDDINKIIKKYIKI